MVNSIKDFLYTYASYVIEHFRIAFEFCANIGIQILVSIPEVLVGVVFAALTD